MNYYTGGINNLDSQKELLLLHKGHTEDVGPDMFCVSAGPEHIDITSCWLHLSPAGTWPLALH